MSDLHPLVMILAVATMLAFLLAVVGADIGASGAVMVRALCAVAVLGSSTVTAAIQFHQS